MKMFIVPAGTKVLLSNDGKESEEIISKKETSFFIEDVEIDPVTYYNKLSRNAKTNNGFNTNQADFALQILGPGYFKFKLTKGVHTIKDYEYAYVIAKDVQTV